MKVSHNWATRVYLYGQTLIKSEPHKNLNRCGSKWATKLSHYHLILIWWRHALVAMVRRAPWQRFLLFWDLHSLAFDGVKFEANRSSLKILIFFDFFDDVFTCPALMVVLKIDWMVFLSSTYSGLCPCKIWSQLEHFENIITIFSFLD